MCGIVGIVNLVDRQTIHVELLNRMNNSQHHRGPDESGIHTEPGVGLGHRRLSIIDLSTGQQPLFNEDNSVVVVYNGEIYNYQALMSELCNLGHTFRTKSDTEVIVHAWEQWGENCVEKFRGMFAFAIWDRNKDTLFLARDRLGIKPLYYTFLKTGELLFASELKALVIHPAFDRKVNNKAVEDYFAFGYIPEPKTIYESTYKLSPGHTLKISGGQNKPLISQYWDVSFQTQAIQSDSDIIDEFIARFKEAVEIRMIAEVPLGAFLSGGVDSSSVVALMAESSADRINTCAIGFTEQDFDETEYANEVASRYHCNHYSRIVDINDFDLVDKLSEMFDEPYADSSAIPTYRVCELARKKVTVALSGDGGDENLAGYRRYQTYMAEEKLKTFIPQAIRRPVFGMLGKIYPQLDFAPRIFRAKAMFQSMARDNVEGYFHEISVIRNPLRREMFSKRFQRELSGYSAVEVFRHYENNAPTKHPLSLVQYLDMKTYLVGDILTKVDRTSMANSLEVRVPFLDHHFLDWMSTLPPDLKLQDGIGKKLLKKAMEPKLPNDILYRRKKGFAVPLADWFRGPLKERVHAAVTGEVLAETDIFNRKTLNTIYDDHISKRRDYSAALWALLMYESFQRKAFGL